MNVLLAVNEKAIEKYVSSMKEINVLKVVKNNKTLYKDVIALNPHIVIISNTLPGKERIEDIIIKLRAEQKHTRVIYLYSEDDLVRKKFTNFLIENEVYDFHVGVINEDILNELILEPKTKDDVKLEVISLEEQEEINKQLKAKEEYKAELRKKLEQKLKQNVSPGDTTKKDKDTNSQPKEQIQPESEQEQLSQEQQEEIENKIDEQVQKEVVPELEVQLIERVEEIEKEVIKVERETVYKTKLVRQQTYAVLSLYNGTIKDLFVSNLSYLLSDKIKKKVLVIDFETPFPTLDHHFNIDKYIYINELYSSKQLTGVSGCLSALKKNMLNTNTFSQFVKEVKGFKNLYILTGLYDLDEFDRVELEDINKIIECASKNYDVVILSLNNFLQNAFTYSGLINADKILLVSEGTYTNGRANLALIHELTNYHQVKSDKFHIVEWGNLMNNEKLNKIYQGYDIIGRIKSNNKYLSSLLNKQILTKSEGHKKCDIDSYMRILEKLGYFEKEGILNKIPFLNNLISKNKQNDETDE